MSGSSRISLAPNTYRPDRGGHELLSPLPAGAGSLVQTSAAIVTAADAHPPEFDLGFDEIQKRMTVFANNLGTHISRGKQQIMNNRNEHSKKINELRGM